MTTASVTANGDLGRPPESSSTAAGAHSIPRAATRSAWRRLADGTRQILSCDPGASLHELARRQAVSPHHLSRVFHASTGITVPAYRNQLRVREALERLADGERSLTSLATDLGFADHAHMARTVRRETGAAPSDLRRLLATAKPPKPAPGDGS